MTNVDAVPEDLRSLPQWVCWAERERGGKQTKIPVAPETGSFASVQDSRTWTSFERAVECAAGDDSIAGVGFVFTEGDPFVGIDLDDCRDSETGEPELWAQEVLGQLDSFSEVSPSGTGFHVYVRGELPDGGNRSGNIECYDSGRFFTVTGRWVSGTPMGIHERSDALGAVHAEHIAAPETEDDNSVPESSTTSMDDEEILSKAKNAKNGPKFSRLWNGNTSGYDSHSEADMALCFLLAFWTGRNVTQMDRLFRQSGLYRQKWDERHYGDRRTYGEGTIERAVQETTEVYEPRTAEHGESQAKPEATATIASRDEVPKEPLWPVPEKLVAGHEERIANLEAALASLEAQHEYLYEMLQREQEQHEHTRIRMQELEEIVEERKSWFGRLF